MTSRKKLALPEKNHGNPKTREESKQLNLILYAMEDLK